jgi:hypothetical protein
MTKRMLKGAMLVAACGTMHHIACLGGGLGWLWQIASGALPYVGYEFVLDNDAVFDLFQDDFGTGALYDDRFTAAPTRAEP